MCRMGGGPIRGRWVSEGATLTPGYPPAGDLAPWTQGTPSVEAAGAGLLGVSVQSPEVYVAGLSEQVKGGGQSEWTVFALGPHPFRGFGVQGFVLQRGRETRAVKSVQKAD